MTGVWLNLGCGTHYAERPWVNIDVVSRPDEGIDPDVIANTLDGLPYDDGQAERVFCGHVLEHVRWDLVPRFLAEVHRVLMPDGMLLVTGPDWMRAADYWRRGLITWEDVEQCSEHAAGHGQPEGWDGARHQWNCSQQRAVEIVAACGFDIVESWQDRMEQLTRFDWPVVNPGMVQIAFTARRP